MYPFSTRLAWLAASRYKHILKGFELHPVPDTLVQERLEAMARWSRIRAIVTLLLYAGAAASLASVLAQLLPGLADANDALQRAAAFTGASAGLLTLAFLFLTRLLSQIEADVLTLLLRKEKRLHD
ncbi:MAG: hypothetical protein ABR562_03325 [Thermoplasmatota archaeon]